jgi:hypothetical protein
MLPAFFINYDSNSNSPTPINGFFWFVVGTILLSGLGLVWVFYQGILMTFMKGA